MHLIRSLFTQPWGKKHFITLGVLKLVSMVVLHVAMGSGPLGWVKVNNDELSMGEVAYNYLIGNGYITTDVAPANKSSEITTYRGTYPIWAQAAAMYTYAAWDPSFNYYNNRVGFYLVYGALVQLIYLVLFFFALRAFYSILRHYQYPQLWQNIGTCIFFLYPSVLWYVGANVYYENWAVCILIILFAAIATQEKTHAFPTPKMWILILLTAVICLFRPQVLFAAAGILAIPLLKSLTSVKPFADFKKLSYFISLPILYVILNIPVFIKNHHITGHWVLNTQVYAELYQGHNPYARGSWCGVCIHDKQSPFYQYLYERIPGYYDLSEYDRLSAVRRVAIQWATTHPLQEIELTARKVAIFFLPHNENANYIHPVTLLVHLLALGYVGFLLYRIIIAKQLLQHWELLMPVAGALFVSLVFFTGYRWRYYAEPFLLLMAFQTVRHFVSWVYKNH